MEQYIAIASTALLILSGITRVFPTKGGSQAVGILGKTIKLWKIVFEATNRKK